MHQKDKNGGMMTILYTHRRQRISHTLLYIYILQVSLRIIEEEERRRRVKWTKKHQGTKKKGEGTWKGKKELRLSDPYSCFTSQKRTITYSFTCVCCSHIVKEKR